MVRFDKCCYLDDASSRRISELSPPQGAMKTGWEIRDGEAVSGLATEKNIIDDRTIEIMR